MDAVASDYLSRLLTKEGEHGWRRMQRLFPTPHKNYQSYHPLFAFNIELLVNTLGGLFVEKCSLLILLEF